MIQELLAGERKISTTTPPPAEAALQQLNLRCPRCDSTNTKFCYYNNYNLTQPRHFCKTCRRYWTKGGALRNVPIGGGCRKNKISTPPGKSTSAYAKLRTSFSSLSSDISKQSFHLDPSSPPPNHANILWPPPQNSHIFALLRAAQNPNPNPNPNATSLWRNNQPQPNGMIPSGGEAQPNSGIQELFQRLKSSRSGGYYYGGQQPASLTSNVLESAPVNGSGEFSYLNSAFSWADVAAPSAGAYP